MTLTEKHVGDFWLYKRCFGGLCLLYIFLTWIPVMQAYGRDLMEAQDWCRKYMRSGNVKDLTQAWDLYYHVFRRISKQLPQVDETMRLYFE